MPTNGTNQYDSNNSTIPLILLYGVTLIIKMKNDNELDDHRGVIMTR